MTAPTLQDILEKTVSADPKDQQVALDYLKQALESNFAEFLKHLTEILAQTGQKPTVRQAAGLQLKNVLVTKDEKLKEQLVQRWMTVSEPLRFEIKNSVLQTLGTESTRPSIAAQCVASIACAELPLGLWPECITRLMQNVVEEQATEMLKESSLEALGYICQDLESDVLQARSKEIVTAIFHGMKQQEQSNNVRLAATQALLNSLEFIRPIFENE
uniref:Importin N-terminal domain-containing protein n=1 Tax=Romanomermis culicivorax TaxID=13658 RepID=A0A915I8F4_ROMCU